VGRFWASGIQSYLLAEYGGGGKEGLWAIQKIIRNFLTVSSTLSLLIKDEYSLQCVTQLLNFSAILILFLFLAAGFRGVLLRSMDWIGQTYTIHTLIALVFFPLVHLSYPVNRNTRKSIAYVSLYSVLCKFSK